MRIGFIGAGRMGWPMVVRLHAAGHEVTVLCRSDDARTRTAGAGVGTAASIAEACTGAELVIVCVFTDDQVKQVCLGPGGIVESAERGAALVIHTTGSPTTAEALAAAGQAKDLAVLDVPVSGGPNDIEAGQIALFVGGATTTLEAARPALAAYGSPIIHAGPLGYGQRTKLVNNALFSANLGMTADAMRLGNELGLPDDVLIPALTAGSSARPSISILSHAGSVERLAATIGSFVGKDVRVALEIAGQLGADLGLMGEVLTSPYVRKNVLNEG